MAKKSGSYDVARDNVWGPFDCYFTVNSDAEEKPNKQTGENYLECKRLVPGGAVYVYLYGYGNKGSVLGKNVAIQAILRTKNRGENGRLIHYLRCDMIDTEKVEKPTCRLYIGRDNDPNVHPIQSLPREVFKEEGRRFMVAFLPLKG